ncbi:hypothetical protein [Exiguobacterium sp. s5]|uniref:hypothetical protein n=1 Tax=Exiguobacterium sp. s5 TaxID=2751239 RepID=UPI001BEBD4EE|nr:hypothetical protein [Exiguobacterium sp. s5]
MNPFGIILILMLFYMLFNTSSFKQRYMYLLVITICIETFINLGFFFKISNFELQYSEFMLAILGMLSMTYLLKNKVNKSIITIGLLFIGSLIISGLILIVLPYSKPIITFGMPWTGYFTGEMAMAQFTIQSIKMSLRIILYVLITIVSVSILSKSDVKELTKRFISFGYFVVGYGYLEFVVKNFLQSDFLSSFNNWFFGLGDWTVEVLIERSDTFALQGFTKEPAHFAAALFSLTLVIVFSGKSRKTLISLLFIGLIMFLSRSFSAVLYLATLSSIYAIFNNRKTIFVSLTTLFVFTVTLSSVFEYYLIRLGNVVDLLVLNRIDQTYSEHIRIISVIENFKIFLDRPLFGIGIGTSYAHGFIPTLLASLGLFGFILWLILIFKGIAKMNISFDNSLIIFLLIVCWTFTGSINNVYSMSLFLITLVIRYTPNYCGFENEVENGI